MKKGIKFTLWGSGILIAVLVLIATSFIFKMKSELKEMKVVETKELTNNVFAIKNTYVNMFLVKDSDNYIAIDAGADIKLVREELKKLNIDSLKVTAVLLTHADGDHTAALKVFKNATIYMSREEEQMINGKTYRMLFRKNSISRKNYKLLDDGQTLKIGNTNIFCILTPGHTPGSMSYVINSRYLFVGDAFGLKNGKITKPNSFFSMDMPTAVKSFTKINNLSGVKYIFTAHNGYTDNYKNAVNTILK
jgi:glyoxylase-like metal-dependent hydrolase (beta-lactamase superfamily II)